MLILQHSSPEEMLVQKQKCMVMKLLLKQRCVNSQACPGAMLAELETVVVY